MPVVYPQRSGVDGIKDTLAKMQELVNRSFLAPLIRKQAVQATSNCPTNDTTCKAASLMIWVQKSMHFVKDPVGVEALHDPLMIAREIERNGKPFGDCDDFSIYLATLMKSIGIPVSFRVVGFQGGRLSHVYVMGPKQMKLDATRNVWNPSIGELLPETSALEWRI